MKKKTDKKSEKISTKYKILDTFQMKYKWALHQKVLNIIKHEINIRITKILSKIHFGIQENKNWIILNIRDLKELKYILYT